MLRRTLLGIIALVLFVSLSCQGEMSPTIPPLSTATGPVARATATSISPASTPSLTASRLVQPTGVAATATPSSTPEPPSPTPRPASSTAVPTTIPPPTFTPLPPTAVPTTKPPPTLTPPPPTVTPLPPTPVPTVDTVVSVWEGEVVLDTYGWEQALVPTEEGDPIYPYPRMDFGLVGSSAPRTYRTVVLENTHVRVTFLPDLGGRILRWEDRTTGRLLTYANSVVKPVDGWGFRGWWLGTGGLEWAFPTDEHGLNEYRPWQYQLLSGSGWRGVKVWDTEDRTGLLVEVTAKLYAGRSDLEIVPRIANPTDGEQRFQFWINAMLTLAGGYAPTPGLRFWVPTERMIVHSTRDASLPSPGETISWPTFGGRDFSRYSEWQRYLGLFATASTGVMGAYDEQVDQGIIRVYPGAVARGVKIFCLGELPAAIYADDGGRYFELWGGYTQTFWDYAVLPAGGTVSWEERWYPVHGIGGLSWAGEDLAASLLEGPEGVQVGLYSSKQAGVLLLLKQNGAEVARWELSIGPEQAFLADHAGSGVGWELEIWRGEVLVARVVP